MERLTLKRCNGIKEGYWSPSKKQELVDRLAAYEDTKLEPLEVERLKRVLIEWKNHGAMEKEIL